MEDAIEKPKTFEERMMDKIRDSIGDLMTAEDLKKIVERGVEEALFKRDINPQKTHWNSVPERLPSLVDKMVEQFLKEAMATAVNKWMEENKEKLAGAVDNAIKIGAGNCMIDALDARVAGTFHAFGQMVREQLKNGAIH